jgi:7,8-dihydropterin-6-yl-methyl-4-(beta-D-ribofuranosyl)aminobenzene 5'-phosphate synthase
MSAQQLFALFALVLPAAVLGSAGDAEAAGPEPGRLRLTIVFDNIPRVDGLETGWGYACLVEGLEKTILFDTGADGEILLSNMRKLGIDPADVDVVFLSHVHGDHTRGLQRFLETNHDVDVWMPASFPESFVEGVRSSGARAHLVEGPVKVCEGAHSTGEMGERLIEQALVLEARRGLVVVSGCAHPDIAGIVARTRRLHERRIGLVAGGFHLRSLDDAEFGQVVRTLRDNGVEQVAPSHCTGERAMRAFRQIWGSSFVEAGCGTVIDF